MTGRRQDALYLYYLLKGNGYWDLLAEHVHTHYLLRTREGGTEGDTPSL
jgi:hypothetical protein